ncbi:MAG TPA: SDR family NAD(P)-dependent oxidoreductase [Pedomonas sp.]|uniref:SDR family NAD(P)-dependent oxidoreductase n=1 Tax=Pedomonas sp. TaxID=2976421 RepID=UPI002F40CA83
MQQKNPMVAVVTGASRGAGRGIAAALGQYGATVYVTGRTMRAGEAALPGTILETAEAVTQAGGRGIAVQVDHADDAAVAALFRRVEEEQGRLDLLVNNVAHIDDQLIEPGPFWEKSLSLANILDVGLRSQYVASYHAAPLMARQKSGLIVFTSSFGSNCYMHGPAYGAQKAGVDKMAYDMSIDLQDHGVAVVSIWMGILATERTKASALARPDEYGHALEIAETPEFTGRLIARIFEDPNRMDLTGKVLIGAEQALSYGLMDEGGRQPVSHRPMLGGPPAYHPAIVR